MNPSPSWHRCEPSPNSRAFSVPATRGQASFAPRVRVSVTEHHSLQRGGPFCPRGICASTVPRCPAPPPTPRPEQRHPARGRPARGAAARTCCCPLRRALCRDERGADVSAGVIIKRSHLFIYLLVCLFAYLIIYLFPFHGALPGRLRACARPCPPPPGIRACGGGLGGE